MVTFTTFDVTKGVSCISCGPFGWPAGAGKLSARKAEFCRCMHHPPENTQRSMPERLRDGSSDTQPGRDWGLMLIGARTPSGSMQSIAHGSHRGLILDILRAAIYFIAAYAIDTRTTGQFLINSGWRELDTAATRN